MKTIVLIRTSERLIKYILDNTDYNIIALCNDQEVQVKFRNVSRVLMIFDAKYVFQQDSTNELTYDEIQEYRATQLWAENDFNRWKIDYQIKKKSYYFALNFWIGIFKNNKIDVVVLNVLNHGSLDDGIPHDIAVQNNIPVYCIEPIFAYMSAIKKSNTNHYLKMQNGKKQNFDQSKFYETQYNLKLDNIIDRKVKNNLLRKICNLAYSAGGSLLLEFLYCCSELSFKRTFSFNGIQYNYIDRLKAYIKLRKTKNYLDRNCVEYDPDKKYIFYAMHFEPEGGTLARVTLESQIFIIRLISQALPNGWVLYVKEHPHQFELNNVLMYYFINQMNYFKSKAFYEEIMKIDNVKIIKRNIESKNIIRNAKAVSTINGTIALEAIDFNKPVLLFGADSTILKYSKAHFKIKSYSDCKKALFAIDQGFIPDYSDVNEILLEYAANTYEEDKRIFTAIIQDVENQTSYQN